MSAHTPGRLLAGVCIYEDGSKHFCAVQEGSEKKVVALSGLAGEANEQEAMSNSSRLAACWNACDGLHTESLECGKPLADQIVDALNQRDALLAQRKELLEALEHIACMTNDGYAERHAREAIAAASVEGGTV